MKHEVKQEVKQEGPCSTAELHELKVDIYHLRVHGLSACAWVNCVCMGLLRVHGLSVCASACAWVICVCICVCIIYLRVHLRVHGYLRVHLRVHNLSACASAFAWVICVCICVCMGYLRVHELSACAWVICVCICVCMGYLRVHGLSSARLHQIIACSVVEHVGSPGGCSSSAWVVFCRAASS